jgi:lipopolysaccharide transport system permease protein
VILAGAGGVLLNGAVRLTLLIVAMPFFGLELGPGLLLLPVAFAALVLLGIVIGLILAPFGLLYDDVGRALPILILFWFLLSPILYPIPAGEAWLRLNPVAPLIDACRSALIGAPLPGGFYAVVAAAAAALPVVMLFYRLTRPHLTARLG